MKRILLLSIPALLLLAACGTNRAGAEPSTVNSSRPNYSSLYYFATGAVDFQNGNYKDSGTRFTRASQSDPLSPLIRKYIILSRIYLYSAEQTDAAAVKEVLKQQQAYISVDDETLEAVHGFYNEVADTTGILATLITWQEKQPSPRPYILRFIYEYKFRDYADVRWLYTALDMAWNDPADLAVLGRFLMLLDDPRALEALIRLHQLSPSQEGDDMLVRQLFSEPDSLAVAQYFRTLRFPDDADLMNSIADGALSLEHPHFFPEAADVILASGDPGLTEYLAVYSLYKNATRYYPDLLQRALAYSGKQDAEARTALALAAMALYNKQPEPIPGLLDKLRSTQDYDLLPAYYKAVYASTLSDSVAIDSDAFVESLGSSLLASMPESPRRDYLLWFCGPVEDSLHIQYYTEVKAALIADLMEQGKASPDDIDFMAFYFGSKDHPQARIAMLKKGVELYPDLPDMLNNLGYSMLIEGMDPDEAVTYINRALSLDPGNTFFLDSLAWYHYLIGDYQTALELIQAPLRMENLPSEIAYHAGLIYMRLNDFENARAMMNKAIQIGDDPTYVDKATRALSIWGD